MTRASAEFFVLVAGVSILASPLLAHHGRDATYDMKRQVSLKGTVAEVLWRNPHIVICAPMNANPVSKSGG